MGFWDEELNTKSTPTPEVKSSKGSFWSDSDLINEQSKINKNRKTEDAKSIYTPLGPVDTNITKRNIKTAEKVSNKAAPEAMGMLYGMAALPTLITTELIRGSYNTIKGGLELKEEVKDLDPEQARDVSILKVSKLLDDNFKLTTGIGQNFIKSIVDSQGQYIGWDPVTKSFKPILDFKDPESPTGMTSGTLRRKIEDEPISTLLDISMLMGPAKGFIKTTIKNLPTDTYAFLGQQALKQSGGVLPKGLSKTAIRDAYVNLGKQTDLGMKLVNREMQRRVTSLVSDAAQDSLINGNKMSEALHEHISILSKQEQASLPKIAMGLEPIPVGASKELTTALKFLKKVNLGEEKFLQKLDVLSRKSVDNARFMSALNQKFGKPIELIDDVAGKSKASRYLQVTQKEFDGMVAELRKDLQFTPDVKAEGKFLDPFYYPMVEAEKSVSGKIKGALKVSQDVAPGFTKQRTGAMYLSDAWEKNPLRAWSYHANQVSRLKSVKELLDQTVKVSGEIPYKGGPVPKGYRILDVDGYIKGKSSQLDYTSEVLKRADQYGDLNIAAEQVYKDMLLPLIEKNKLGSKAFLIPEGAAKGLETMFPAAKNEVINMLYDTPMKYWKIIQLQLKTKWQVSNAVGGLNMAVMSGADPMSYVKAMTKESKGLVPKRVQDSSWNYTLNEIPPKTPLGWWTTKMTKLNQVLDDYFKRTVAISEGKSIAKKQLKETVKGVVSQEAIYAQMRQNLKDPVLTKRIVDKTYDWLPNFHSMSPWEKTLVRRAVPFYSFIKHQVMMDVRLVTKYPGRTQLVNTLNKAMMESMDEQDKKNYKEGKVFLNTDVTHPYGPDGPAVPVKRYLDTRGVNPFVPGGLLSVISPYIKTVGQYLTNMNWFTKQELEPSQFHPQHGIAIPQGKGKWLVPNATGDGLIESKHPIKMLDYVLTDNIWLVKWANDYYKNQKISSTTPLTQVYKHKSVTETVINTLIYSTSLENEQLEKLKELTNAGKNPTALINEYVKNKDLREMEKKNPGMIKETVKKQFKDLQSRKGREFPDQMDGMA